VNMPSLQIRTTPALLGMETQRGLLGIRQPKATLEMEITRPDLQIRQQRGDLYIDQSRAWDALGKAGSLTTMSRIYGQSRGIAMEGIARIVDNGNHLANIKSKNNAIADLGLQNTITTGQLDFAGPASYDNVDISYQAHTPDFEARNAIVDINAHASNVEFNYRRNSLNIFVKQHASVEIIPPNLDILV
jgi:hypothetical protein